MNYDAQQPSFELPTPQTGQEGSFAQPAEQAAARPELAHPAPPVPVPQPMAQSPVMPVAPVPQVAPIDPAQQAAGAGLGPALADDSDLIEKEWVDKAKQIVAATREDPYVQNKELSKFKADYLKKRYGKDMKLEES